MDISCKTSQTEQKEKHLVKILVYTVLSQFPKCFIYALFPSPWIGQVLSFPPLHLKPILTRWLTLVLVLTEPGKLTFKCDGRFTQMKHWTSEKSENQKG